MMKGPQNHRFHGAASAAPFLCLLLLLMSSTFLLGVASHESIVLDEGQTATVDVFVNSTDLVYLLGGSSGSAAWGTRSPGASLLSFGLLVRFLKVVVP